MAKNRNKFFKLCQPKAISQETKENVAKLILILQKRMKLVKEMGSTYMFRHRSMFAFCLLLGMEGGGGGIYKNKYCK
jgi:hypothetical protein